MPPQANNIAWPLWGIFVVLIVIAIWGIDISN